MTSVSREAPAGRVLRRLPRLDGDLAHLRVARCRPPSPSSSLRSTSSRSPSFTVWPVRDRDRRHLARHRRGDVVRVVRVGLGVALAPSPSTERSATLTSRGWPFSSKNTVRVPSSRTSPVVRYLTISVLPRSISIDDLLAGLQAVEEVRRRNRRRVAVLLPVLLEVEEDLRVQQVRQHVCVASARA